MFLLSLWLRDGPAQGYDISPEDHPSGELEKEVLLSLPIDFAGSRN